MSNNISYLKRCQGQDWRLYWRVIWRINFAALQASLARRQAFPDHILITNLIMETGYGRRSCDGVNHAFRVRTSCGFAQLGRAPDSSRLAVLGLVELRSIACSTS
jgi:hypothetical protein